MGNLSTGAGYRPSTVYLDIWIGGPSLEGGTSGAVNFRVPIVADPHVFSVFCYRKPPRQFCDGDLCSRWGPIPVASGIMTRLTGAILLQLPIYKTGDLSIGVISPLMTIVGAHLVGMEKTKMTWFNRLGIEAPARWAPTIAIHGVMGPL